MLDLLLLQAFLAGILVFFAPCSVAMLPAMVSYYLSRPAQAPEQAEPRRGREVGFLAIVGGAALVLFGLVSAFQTRTGQTSLNWLQPILVLGGLAVAVFGIRRAWGATLVVRGLTLGVAAAAGIMVVFTVAGVAFGYLVGDRLSLRQLAAGVLVVAVLMVVAGVLALAGRMPGISVRLAAPSKERRAYPFVFGVAYGVVSLGCNLPVFGLVLFGALASQGLAATALVFVAFGLGISSLLLVTVLVSLVSAQRVARFYSRALPWMNRVTGAVLVLAGVYVFYYFFAVLEPTL